MLGLSVAGPPAGAESGLPLQRFVSLGTDKAKLRTGPGRRYPVEWIYVREGLPMQVTAEYDTWRKVRDWQGGEGWVHQSLLSGRRHLIVTEEVAEIRRTPEAESPVVARLGQGVIARLRQCPAETDWCRVEYGRFKGWMRRDAFWGVRPGEVLE